MTHLRLTGMIEFENNSRKREGSDINEFVVRRKRMRHRRIPHEEKPAQKLYQQQTLWSTINVQKTISPQSPAI